MESAETVETTPEARPAWMAIAGWTSAAAALVFVVGGIVFLQPSGDRAIDVSTPFEVGLGADSFEEVVDPDVPVDEIAMSVGGAAEDPPPDKLSFVDDDEPPPPLVEASPLDAPDLASDGSDANAPAADAAEAPEEGKVPSLADAARPSSAAGGFSDSFDVVGTPWTALSGLWTGSGGRFVQQDTDGFDLIAQLEVDVPEAYKLSVVMAPMSGPLSAGVLLGQQVSGERAGAWLIDFSEAGTVLRVGRYVEESATYEYLEGQPVPEGFDPAGTHKISVLVESTDMTVFLDDEFFTVFDPAPPGRIGLVTNAAATAFDDLVIEPL